MGFRENGDDPTARRRVDPQTQRERDAEVARMRASGVPFRATAAAMGMSLAACRSRCGGQKFADALATGSPGDVVAVVDDELTCEDVQTPEDVQRLNKLEI